MKMLVLNVTDQTYSLLEQLTEHGIYGCSIEEVAMRMLDRALIEMLDKPTLKLKVRHK
jgi:hypothetical protein